MTNDTTSKRSFRRRLSRFANWVFAIEVVALLVVSVLGATNAIPELASVRAMALLSSLWCLWVVLVVVSSLLSLPSLVRELNRRATWYDPRMHVWARAATVLLFLGLPLVAGVFLVWVPLNLYGGSARIESTIRADAFRDAVLERGGGHGRTFRSWTGDVARTGRSPTRH